MGEHAVSTKSNPPRRKFLAGAALGTSVAAGFPMIARAQQPITLRWQSTWPAKDIFHEYALDYAKKVNEMSGGRLRIDVLPAGAVVRAFDLIDAVAKGTLDGGHGVSAYWYGKNSAFSLFGTGPAVGMDANNFLAWMAYGGGQALYDELVQNVLNLDVVGFVYGPMPTQPLGWFKKPVQNAGQLKGLKYRTVGLSIDVFKAMGASVNALPGGEIVPAMDRGLLDAAEFNNASSDRLLGFPDVSKVCMLQSYQAGRGLRDPVQPQAVRRAAHRHEVDPEDRGRGGQRGHVVEGDPPLFTGLHRDAREAGRALLQDAGRHPARADAGLDDGRRRETQRESLLREGARFADGLGAPHGDLVDGHAGRSAHRVQPLVRPETCTRSAGQVVNARRAALTLP